MTHKIFAVLLCLVWAATQMSCGRKTVFQEVPYVPPPISVEDTLSSPPVVDTFAIEPPVVPPNPPDNPPTGGSQPLPGEKIPDTTPAAPLMIEGYTKDQIRFRVQLGAFEKPKTEDDPFFTPVAGQEVRVERAPNGFYRYSIGWFSDLEKAEKLKKDVQSKGYSSAFIIAFGHDDKRINMDMKEVLRLYSGQ